MLTKQSFFYSPLFTKTDYNLLNVSFLVVSRIITSFVKICAESTLIREFSGRAKPQTEVGVGTRSEQGCILVDDNSLEAVFYTSCDTISDVILQLLLLHFYFLESGKLSFFSLTVFMGLEPV